MKSLYAQTWNILLSNFGSNHSLVMRFDRLMQYYKRKIFIKKLYEKCDLETISRPFLIFKEFSKGIWGGLHTDLDKF